MREETNTDLRVGIGVLSYNRPNSLRKCLDSLFENLSLPANVTVSYDVWNEEFESIAGRYPASAIRGPEQGISHANNRLMAFFAGCDACFLVQDDVRFLRCEWLEVYLRGLAVIPYLAFFDPYYIEDYRQPRHLKANFFCRRRRVVLAGQSFWLCHKAPQGAFQGIGRTCIDRVGYFDTRFGKYGIEHHDYWLRTCEAGFAPRDHFYDVVGSAELLKVDWTQPPSLTTEETDAAYRASEPWRKQLQREKTVGCRQIKVTEDVEFRVLQPAVASQSTSLPARTGADILAKKHWIYASRLPILAFHAVDDTPEDRFAVGLSQFRSHLAELARHFRFITVSEALDVWNTEGQFSSDLIVLTFDDGYLDFLRVAEILAIAGIRATIFVPTGWIGKENRWDRGAYVCRNHLSWPELRTICAMGHEIGSHTIDHIRLTRMSIEEAEHELLESKRVLQAELTRPVRSIAYPFGSANATVVRLASQHYDVGFVAGQGNIFDWSECRHLIRRITVTSDEDPSAVLIGIANYMTQAADTEPTWLPHTSDDQRST